MTARELGRRFARPPAAARLLTAQDLLQRFGQPARTGKARLLTPQELARRFAPR